MEETTAHMKASFLFCICSLFFVRFADWLWFDEPRRIENRFVVNWEAWGLMHTRSSRVDVRTAMVVRLRAKWKHPLLSSNAVRGPRSGSGRAGERSRSNPRGRSRTRRTRWRRLRPPARRPLFSGLGLTPWGSGAAGSAVTCKPLFGRVKRAQVLRSAQGGSLKRRFVWLALRSEQCRQHRRLHLLASRGRTVV